MNLSLFDARQLTEHRRPSALYDRLPWKVRSRLSYPLTFIQKSTGHWRTLVQGHLLACLKIDDCKGVEITNPIAIATVETKVSGSLSQGHSLLEA